MIRIKRHKTKAAASFTSVQTFADLVRAVELSDLKPSQKAPIKSAIRKVDDLVGQGNLDLPANVAIVFGQLDAWSPAMAGMTPQSFANTKSRLRKAFEIAKPALATVRQPEKLTGEWLALQAFLDVSSRRSLSRLMHYGHRMGWQPADICDVAIERFRTHLRDEAMIAKPDDVAHRSALAWNKLPETFNGKVIQRLKPRAPKRTNYWIPVDQWPESLQQDLAGVLEELGNPSPFTGKKVRKLKPTTVEQYRSMVRTLVSAAVGAGHPLALLSTLPDVLAPHVVSKALGFLAKRNDGQASHIMLQMMLRTCALARLKALPDGSLKELRHMLHAVEDQVHAKHGRRSMTTKNRKLLDHLEEDPKLRDLVYTLPEHLAQKARRESSARRAPSLMRSALAIELLLNFSMRRENLARLELGKSIRKIGKKDKARWVIELVSDEVKNAQPLRFELCAETAALLEEYLQEWRGKLCEHASAWLFPNDDGECFDPKSLGSAIAEHTNLILGIRITPHQFRHISADGFLELHPDKLMLISEHLGHRDANTTRRYYARSKQKQASREYQEHVVKMRHKAHTRLKPRKAKRPPPASYGQEDFL